MSCSSNISIERKKSQLVRQKPSGVWTHARRQWERTLAISFSNDKLHKLCSTQSASGNRAETNWLPLDRRAAMAPCFLFCSVMITMLMDRRILRSGLEPGLWWLQHEYYAHCARKPIFRRREPTTTHATTNNETLKPKVRTVLHTKCHYGGVCEIMRALRHACSRLAAASGRSVVRLHFISWLKWLGMCLREMKGLSCSRAKITRCCVPHFTAFQRAEPRRCPPCAPLLVPSFFVGEDGKWIQLDARSASEAECKCNILGSCGATQWSSSSSCWIATFRIILWTDCWQCSFCFNKNISLIWANVQYTQHWRDSRTSHELVLMRMPYQTTKHLYYQYTRHLHVFTAR